MATEKTPAPKQPKGIVETYDISNSANTLALASDVAKFIKENKLYQNVQGKEFVNVEGWQYAGSRLSIFPVVEEVIDISNENEIKYSAKVTLLNVATDQTVGAGFAVCSNKENGKKYYQEYAIASMAQTRAIGKAYRNILAWIIRAAGYEPTPAEEMDYQASPEVVPTKQQPKQPDPAKLATTNANKTTTPPAMQATPEQGAEKPKYASSVQKEVIIRLLNNPVITRDEKTKMLLNLNKLDEARAAEVINKLNKTIDDREEEADKAA